ncbi:MAG: phosphatidylglycerophosphatase A [Myxococcota bacterium]|nr:phosphatidylglycerophosphatase A [Myxococcota bacterium]
MNRGFPARSPDRDETLSELNNSTNPETSGGSGKVSGERGLAVWVATVGGAGFGPWAPGTWGALLAVIAFGSGLHRLDVPLYGLVLLALSGLGVWASSAAETYFGRHDDGRIVIDEFVGQLISLFPLVLLQGVSMAPLELPGLEGSPFEKINSWWLLVVTGFVAFRWFDIRKPGPVKWAEDKFKRGAGVMADDIVAGGLGALVVMVPAYLLLASKLRSVGLQPLPVGEALVDRVLAGFDAWAWLACGGIL